LSLSRKAESKEIVKWVGTIYDEGRGKIKKKERDPESILKLWLRYNRYHQKDVNKKNPMISRKITNVD